jgi:hypothetical protein
MRSSKSRSRNKNNRNRNSLGNVVNRVFDSSGPEGKVRGTPQQIIDKYNQLARDAALGNDRVAAENFQQHAEHYLRMLAEAQREQESRREQQERENRERQAQRDRERSEREAPSQDQTRPQGDDGAASRPKDPQNADQPDILELGTNEEGSGLVETPESRAEARAPRGRAKSDDAGTKTAPTETAGKADPQQDKPKKPRAPRKPRSKKTEESAPKEPAADAGGADADTSSDAAE